MDEQEALNEIMESSVMVLTNRKQFERAVRVAMKALEKQIPRKPVDRIMFNHCPCCGNVEIANCNHCPDCGQKLDWRNSHDVQNNP